MSHLNHDDHASELPPQGDGHDGASTGTAVALSDHDGSFANPGLEEHTPRKSDLSEKAAKNRERQVTAILGVSVLASLIGLIGYFVLDLDGTQASVRYSNLTLGLGLGIGFLGIGVAAIHWAKTLMSDVEQVEMRHELASDEETKVAAHEVIAQGVSEANIARRPLLKMALGGAIALAPLPVLVPLIGNLGDKHGWNIKAFAHTLWKKGEHLTVDGLEHGVVRRIKASDVTIGSVFHVVPESLHHLSHEDGYVEEKAKAVTLLVRLDPKDLHEPADRKDWSYHGIVAYSKICTHVGCPVALYEQQTHHLLCPCHQSTFDITDQAKVVFGPAKRPLPQLPITVDSEGYLVAQSDFHEPIGPSYWERKK